MKKHITLIVRILLPLAVMLMAMQVQAASRTVNFSDIMVEPGGTAKMVVSYETDYTDLTGFQVDFVLPDGITLTDAQAGSSLSQACPNLYFSFNPKRDDGETVIMCYNLSGTLPSGKKEAFVLTFRADKRAEKRTYGIKTTLIEFSHKGSSVADRLESQTFFVTVKKPFLSTMRGDVNNDRGISLTDVLMMVDYILDNPSDDFLTSNADFNGDGDISIADILMLVNIILGNPDGISFKWYLIAHSADGQSQPIALDEIGSLAAAGSAYDFAILDNSGNTILENVTRVEFKYEYELEASGYTVPSGMPAAYLFRPMQARLYAASEQGGNRFLVADRNGNNLFARGVTFQHGVDGTTWTAGGSEGEIDDLQFISRANTQMVTGSSDDIIQMLKELSGTDNADAGAVAATLINNPDVEESYTADGENVVVKIKDDDCYAACPLYSLGSVFSDGGEIELLLDMADAGKKMRHLKSYTGKEKIAIFNFFEGGFSTHGSPYETKHIFVQLLSEMFEKNLYNVEVYGHGFDNGGTPTFTMSKLDEVISHSSEYSAIIIMSHGYTTSNGESYFATCEQYKKGASNPSNQTVIIDNNIFLAHSSKIQLASNCLLYLGPCFGIPQNGYVNVNTSVIGWKGKNAVSQIHAGVFFHKLLYSDGWVGVNEALESSFRTDPFNPSTLMYATPSVNQWGFILNTGLQQDYAEGMVLRIGSGKDIFVKKTSGTCKFDISGHIKGGADYYLPFVRVKLEPIVRIQNPGEYSFKVPPMHNAKLTGLDGGNDHHFEDSYTIDDDFLEGVYRINVYVMTQLGWKLLIQPEPVYVIHSKKLDDNYALPTASDEDVYIPSIHGTDGQPVEEITVPLGTSLTYQLDAYPGHTFDMPCLDTDVATVSLSGTTLTVTGVSEGSTYFGVFDRQNHKMAVVNVTVTKGGTYDEREQLIKLYNSTNGDSWTHNDNWCSSKPLADWYGISTYNDLVEYISLADNNLSGSISIKGFEALSNIDIAGNNVTSLTIDSCPSLDLGYGFSLDGLTLDYLELSNCLYDKGQHFLSGSNIKKILFTNFQKCGRIFLQGVVSDEIVLKNCEFDGQGLGVEDNSNVKTLIVEDCNIRDGRLGGDVDNLIIKDSNIGDWWVIGARSFISITNTYIEGHLINISGTPEEVGNYIRNIN